MTIVSSITSDGDWTFGRGRAGYKKNTPQIRQSVVTRLRCLFGDWFLDTQDGIDWYALLGRRGTQPQVLREIEKRVLTTDGVRSIEKLEIINNANRVMTIGLRFTTIYDDTVNENIKVEV